jgi:hypothetical protein
MSLIRRSVAAVLLLLPVLLAPLPSRANDAAWTLLRAGSHGAVATAKAPDAGPRLIFAAFLGDNVTLPSVVKSADGGATWRSVLDNSCSSLAADPSTPGVVYATTAAGLFRSVDYGESWALLNAGIKKGVVVAPWNPNLIFGDNKRSIDGGATWTTMAGLSPYVSYIKVSADPTRIVAWTGGAFQSLDQGATWKGIYDPSPGGGGLYSVGIDPVNSRYYYLGYCNTLNRFRDNTIVGRGGPSGDIDSITVHPLRTNRVYATAQGSLTRSFDNGVGFSYIGGSEGPAPWQMIIDEEGKIYRPSPTGLRVALSGCDDADGDGYFHEPDCGTPKDCNDNNFLVHPGAAEVCNSTVDYNCNGYAGCQDPGCTGTAYCNSCTDADGDGYYNEAYCIPGLPVDCNDHNASIFPGATEIAFDGIDQDCNGYDLTIKVTTATWSKSTHTVVVEATSSYGAAAALQLNLSGPMTWVPPTKKGTAGKWRISDPNIIDGPGFQVTVYGPEGYVDVVLKTVR